LTKVENQLEEFASFERSGVLLIVRRALSSVSNFINGTHRERSIGVVFFVPYYKETKLKMLLE
jgi:hypothetical protein